VTLVRSVPSPLKPTRPLLTRRMSSPGPPKIASLLFTARIWPRRALQGTSQDGIDFVATDFVHVHRRFDKKLQLAGRVSIAVGSPFAKIGVFPRGPLDYCVLIPPAVQLIVCPGRSPTFSSLRKVGVSPRE
jgi:hypothetical protein